MVTTTASWSLSQRKIAGNLQRSYDGGGGGNSYQQAGRAGKLARHGVGVFGRDLQILIGECAVINFWDDGAGHVLGAFDAVEGRVGLQGDALHGGIQFFEAARGADESTAGAEHGDEMGDAALGLLPDFVGRAQVVRLPVRFVGILVGVKILVGMLGGQLAREANRTVGAVGGIGIKNVGTVALQDLLALARNIFAACTA